METLIPQFIKAMGWSILNSLWQSAIIYGILFIVMLTLPKLASKHRHNLAFAAIILMFFAFSYNMGEQLMLNKTTNLAIAQPQQLQFDQYLKNLPQTFSSKAEQYFPVVVVFYIIGILLQLFVIAKGYYQLSKLKKECLSAIPEDWKLIFQRVKSAMGIKKDIRFDLSSIVNVPLVIGYLKPVVLFPIALVNQLDHDQVEAILIHELSHIRRNDFLLNLIKTAIETLLFYNPFVWMAGRFIHIEREHACDDLVVKITGKPLNYAHALLKLELLKDNKSPAYALAATGKTQNLYQRIKRITNMKTNYLNAKQQMAALTLGLACLFSIAWINPSEKKKEINKALKTQMASLNKAIESITMPQDTTKKRKMKIVTVDANGKRTEYNSIKDVPDSLKKSIYADEFAGVRNLISLNRDSTFTYGDSTFKAKLYKEFQSPEAQKKWRKFGDDIAREYNSPQAKAKWKKMGDDMQKKMNSPEEQAKWRKFAEDVRKEYGSPEAQAKWKKMGEGMSLKMNSPEEQAKWKKFGEDIAKEYGSPEAQEKWRKMGEDMAAKMNTSVFRMETDLDQTKYPDAKRFSKLPGINADSLTKGRSMVITNGSVYYLDDQTNNKVKQTEEYKKLKEKFDREVKELKAKIEKEKTEKSKTN
ncbi:M56 family metallopeptidase [Pedobacter psychrotolerans]|uniref:M56 family metallopeptidase n=1 Tax=Pedobacter psychrotolerans TaxID=1843235 RepID=UPI003F9B0DEF